MSALQKIDGKPSACCAWFVSREKCRFPLPDVPQGWTPNPKSLWASEGSEKEIQEIEDYGRAAALFKPISGTIPGQSTSAAVVDLGSEKENHNELEDYSKAASLFKPISGAMAGRFTTASVVDFGFKTHEGLHTPSHEEIAAKEAQRLKEEEDKISPKAHAAKMGMFGPLTRETRPWQPVSRLCKRFGVKVPELPPDMPNEASTSKSGPSFPTSVERDFVVPVQKPDGPRDLANIGLGEDETQGQDTLTYKRPSMDVFKAIFASDDEDSDDEQEKEPEQDEQPDLPPSTTNRSSLVGLVTDDVPVDLGTFKPTFIPREGKSDKSKDKEKSKEKSKEKKEKKKEKKEKKEKEKKGVLVSFAMDDDGTEATQLKQSKDRPKKKRKDKKEEEGDDDVGMWVDKPPPEVPIVISATTSTTADTSSAAKSRKRAIDFM